MTIAAISEALALAHQHLELDRPFEASTEIDRAARACDRASHEGTPVDRATLEALKLLEQRCSAAAAAAFSRLVGQGRQLGTMQRALRAYSDGGSDGTP